MRRSITLVFALLLPAALPATVLAARQWELTGDPLTLDPGVPTAISLTAMNLGSSGSGITCVRIMAHTSFTIASVAIESINGKTSGADFDAWTTVWPGGSVVTFKSPLGTFPLDKNEEAVFVLKGSASTPGPMNWTGSAADDPGTAASTTCGSGSYPSTTLHFTVGKASTPTPTPQATPTPTQTPTPQATPTPTPTPTPTWTAAPGATPRPSATVGAPTSGSPVPSSAAPASSDPIVQASPVPSPSPQGSSAPMSSEGIGGFVVGGVGTAGGGADVPIAGLDGAVAAALDDLPGGAMAWGYPAFVLSVPGLLLLLAVGAQAMGALAWLPFVRRRLGGFGFHRPRDA